MCWNTEAVKMPDNVCENKYLAVLVMKKSFACSDEYHMFIRDC